MLLASQDELVGKPWRLARHMDDVGDRLQRLALKNYHVFVQSQQCSQVVTAELHTISGNVSAVDAGLPRLLARCEQLDKSVQAAAKANAEIQYILSHHAQLMELLEIPALVDACISHDLIEEALDTIQFAKGLLADQPSKAAATSSILRNLLLEVQEATAALRAKIIETLQQDLPLAKCLHLVAYLRRVDALWAPVVASYDEALKHEFLACRSAWLTRTTQGLSTADPYHYLMQLIDAKRTSWFDLITQYTAIFGHQQTVATTDAPLCSWAMQLVVDLMTILDTELPKMDDFGSIASVMEQMLFFASSLGRVQIDFSAMVLVAFESHIFARVTGQWTAVVADFQAALQAHTQPKAYGATPIVLASFRQLPAAPDAPPHALMASPVLAQLTNGLLASFNDLRLCTLTALHYRLSAQLQATLERVVDVVAAFVAATGVVLSAKADDARSLDAQLLKLTQMLEVEWVPYILRCFDCLFSSQKGLPTALREVSPPQPCAADRS
ncbi:conserved oligomeric Golgi complex subunit 8 [Achlya hypogyna]|uniref:Conserved oligomeric Golgi complex subunit 8 n=1 Tax=Achlya hypogyna TaxID=1202772 RepID=A0A1V9ZL02_ACHHY|nr:conserved oligomeric Golgi complex subunit 8 [Achlya hypogyna]